jgi:hypothetical protein
VLSVLLLFTASDYPIVLSVLLLFTASDYRFGIFKLFFQQYFKYISFIGGETGVPGKIQRRVASQ